MNLFNLFPKLSEKRVTLSDLGILYRVFVNWSEKEIIDYKVSESAKNKEVLPGNVSSLIILKHYGCL